MKAAVTNWKQALNWGHSLNSQYHLPIFHVQLRDLVLISRESHQKGKPTEKNSYSQLSTPMPSLTVECSHPKLTFPGALDPIPPCLTTAGSMPLLPTSLRPYRKSLDSFKAHVASPHPARGPAAAPGPGQGWGQPPPATGCSLAASGLRKQEVALERVQWRGLCYALLG